MCIIAFFLFYFPFLFFLYFLFPALSARSYCTTSSHPHLLPAPNISFWTGDSAAPPCMCAACALPCEGALPVLIAARVCSVRTERMSRFQYSSQAALICIADRSRRFFYLAMSRCRFPHCLQLHGSMRPRPSPPQISAPSLLFLPVPPHPISESVRYRSGPNQRRAG